MFLFELFDKPYKWYIVKKDKIAGVFTAKFKTDKGLTYVFEALTLKKAWLSHFYIDERSERFMIIRKDLNSSDYTLFNVDYTRI